MYKIFTEKRYLMRISFIYVFLLISGFQLLSAPNSRAQGLEDIMVTIDINERNLEYLIKKIELQTDLTFAYLPAEVHKYKHVAISPGRQSVKSALDKALDKTDLRYRYIENSIILFPKSGDKNKNLLEHPRLGNRSNVIPNDHIYVSRRGESVEKLASKDLIDIYNKRMVLNVSGQVVDANNEPLIGVNIQVKGTNKGTATDIDGRFSFSDLDDQAVLVVSYIGYKTQEVAVDGQTSLTIILQEDVQTLDEVVVVGYGESSTKKLTTSVSTVNKNQINDMPITNIADAFTGNVSGVMVEQGDGGPGANPVIRIRGYGSINAGSEPLYVIDGMIVSSNEFRLLNPKSVESVNILKDAAAGSIYGSRAGNGVVIVTTKSGSGKPKFSYNSTFGLKHAEKKIPVLSGPEYIQYSNEAYAASGKDKPSFSPNVGNTNWQDEIFRTALYQNHQINANGSTDMVKYNISFNYLDDEGIIITTWEKNYSSTGNLEFKLHEKLDLGFTYSASINKRRDNSKLGGAAHGNGGILEDAIVQYPVIPVYLENGDYGQQISEDWGTPVVYGGYGNPVAGLKEVFQYGNEFSGIGRTFLNYKPLEGLSFNVSFSGLWNSGYSNSHESPYLAAQGHPREANFSNPRYDAIAASQSNSIINGYTIEGFVDYKRTFSNVHNFKITIGSSKEYNGYRNTNAFASVNDRGTNALDPLPRFDNYLRPNIYGANDVSGGGGFWEETFISSFGRIKYDYDNKYLFMASMRRDGSSKFAPNNRYGIFPAISTAWRMSEEPFMQSQGLFNELKFRISYGISGNDQIGNYAWQGGASYGSQYFYGPTPNSVGAAISAYPSSVENPNLKWESNEQYNVGVDMSMVNNRLTLTSDFYVRNTKDILIRKPLPAENGISGSILDNLGNVRNTGIEFALSTANITNDNFQWTTNWIFNKVWNKAIDLFTESGRISLGSGTYDMVWIREGYEMFEIWGYKAIGVFETEDQLNKYPRPRGSKIGDPIYEEVVEDNVLNSDDYQLLGHGLPSFTFGWVNSLNYKNWGLNIVVDGNQGASKYIPSFRNQAWVSPIEGNLSKEVYDNAGATYGAPNLDYSGNRLERNSYMVYDASYLRVKNLTIGYNLPQNLCNTLLIKELRLSISSQNLVTISDYPWYNPQANFYNGSAGAAQFGVDYGSYPLSKSFVFGINLTF